jgi:DNA (cytosine-5)-methyltransferase 1
MNVLDLFSGIGGFSLGLERAGMRTVAFCEIEPFARRVLRKHWPEVPIYDDVRSLSSDALRRDGITVDLICGGFPCQDISLAGKGAGLAGERSGLWREFARLIGEIRPRYVIVENVAALLGRGLGTVLGDLAALGFDAEWHCIPASAVGAPHRRDRVWIVAYPHGRRGAGVPDWQPEPGDACSPGPAMADAKRPRAAQSARSEREERLGLVLGGEALADAAIIRCGEGQEDAGGCGEGMRAHEWSRSAGGGWWLAEPDVGRVAHGVPARVDRLRGLGNAVVPQVVELLGRAIIKHAAACDGFFANASQSVTERDGLTDW